ncbi:hypothetical protein [Sinorhizobium meliloti]|uniref:hypothetical protein n=1 Tax=Rhizobium meliloti TaxID=382 RepID=UPI0013E40F6A|nr:hypothetical protein [Sinorhizobium meliloti]
MAHRTEFLTVPVTAVAAICGGYDHAKTTTEDFFELCHAGSRETVEDWMKD